MVSRGIDVAACGGGIWRGFAALVIGALLQPIAQAVSPLLGASFLLITAVVAFVIAGSRTGAARIPLLHGAVAAVASYLLVLPLVLLSGAHTGPQQVLATAALAVAVGGLAGLGARLVRAAVAKRGENA